jgi:hypothetical protein
LYNKPAGCGAAEAYVLGPASEEEEEEQQQQQQGTERLYKLLQKSALGRTPDNRTRSVWD